MSPTKKERHSREWQVDLVPFGGRVGDVARLRRRHGYWVVILLPGLLADKEGEEDAAEADWVALKEIKTEIRRRSGLANSALSSQSNRYGRLHGAEMWLRAEACMAIMQASPSGRAGDWLQAVYSLLIKAQLDDDLVTPGQTTPVRRAKALMRLQERQSLAAAGGRAPPTHFRPRKQRKGTWEPQEDRALVQFFSPDAEGKRGPLAPDMLAAVQENLPTRSMRMIRKRIAYLNRLLRGSLATNDVTRVPPCFAEVRYKLERTPGTDWAALYNRHALGATVRGPGAYRNNRGGGGRTLQQRILLLERRLSEVEAKLEAVQNERGLN